MLFSIEKTLSARNKNDWTRNVTWHWDPGLPIPVDFCLP